MINHNALHTYQLSEAHSYIIGKKRQLSYLTVFIWGALVIYQIISLGRAIYAHDMLSVWGTGALIFLFCMAISSTLYAATKQWLVVGREGMIYNSGAYTLYAPWQNIQKVVRSPHTGEAALHLQPSAEEMAIEQGIREGRSAIKVRFHTKSPVKIESSYDLYNYIPLPVVKNDLWQDIQQHLPELDMTVLKI